MASPFSKLPTKLPEYNCYGFVLDNKNPKNLASSPMVYDGDTLTMLIDLGHHCWLDPLNYRLYGINAPEMPTPEGKLARDYLRGMVMQYALQTKKPPVWLAGGFAMVVVTHQAKRLVDFRPTEDLEKYGRYLVELFGIDQTTGKWINLNAKMVEAGHAVIYVP
jgi:endonuclease YncB( thermonuclease family)